jgi:hypothetical protein
MIISDNTISIPAKKYITFLMKNVEHLQAAIIQYENQQLKVHVYQWSDKRRVINRKQIITAAELIGIQKAEKAIWARKEK